MLHAAFHCTLSSPGDTAVSHCYGRAAQLRLSRPGGYCRRDEVDIIFSEETAVIVGLYDHESFMADARLKAGSIMTDTCPAWEFVA
jgi:hypothetical protein